MRRVPPYVAAGASDPGRVRPGNEDAFALADNWVVVSDGMGGHHGGAAAARIVVTLIPTIWKQRWAALRSRRSTDILNGLRDTVVELSRSLQQRTGAEPGLAGMGATVVMAFLYSARAYIANMGDSRAYHFRSQELTQLTEDHSVVALLLRTGQITAEQANDHPSRGMLSRYVGMQGLVYPDVKVTRLKPGDRLLLCTDGLTSMVADEALAMTLRETAEPQQACDRLVAMANEAGGRDNVTVAVVEWRGRRRC